MSLEKIRQYLDGKSKEELIAYLVPLIDTSVKVYDYWHKEATGEMPADGAEIEADETDTASMWRFLCGLHPEFEDDEYLLLSSQEDTETTNRIRDQINDALNIMYDNLGD